MKLFIRKVSVVGNVHILFFTLTLLAIVFAIFTGSGNAHAEDESKRLITVYDRGVQSAFLTSEKTIGAALTKNGIELDPRDTVEPSRDEELVAPDYRVNIYRARPVVVIDGSTRVKIMTPYQVADRIAQDAGITLYPEDDTIVKPSTDFIGDGAGLQLTIDRAKNITFDLYTKKTQVRTQGDTVAEMLEEKGIVLGQNGRVSVPLETPITEGMEVRVWREGKQTVAIDQAEPFGTERIQDADRPIGYKAVQAEGVNGVRTITYEVEVKDGVQVSRTVIADIVTQQPTKQVVIVGIKSNPNALTKAKGAQYYTDSKGVSHRETYYDLDMSRVMQSCGQGGYYEIRIDGVKVDRDGYAIIAANYGNYPKCSIVETSVGPGKVYDTGGFAARHPTGFDIATDWSRGDGI
ncbi:MAG: ubiquitin-like domain-containing protein [Candidatus Microsaccharimonas sp.]